MEFLVLNVARIKQDIFRLDNSWIERRIRIQERKYYRLV